MVQCIIKMEAIEIETKLDSDADFEADVDKTMGEVIKSAIKFSEKSVFTEKSSFVLNVDSSKPLITPSMIPKSSILVVFDCTFCNIFIPRSPQTNYFL